MKRTLCAQLWDKKDLGLHSELVGDGVVDLLEAGIINNKKKNKNLTFSFYITSQVSKD